MTRPQDQPAATTAPEPDPDTATVGTPADAVLAEVADVLDEVAAEAEPELEAEMDALDVPRRALFVHAHPDDETIGTGGTMARYAAEGAHVVLVTCTLGEEGEVLVPELAHLASDRDDALGQHRVTELATALEALGVRDSRFLGGPGRYRDSGMLGEPTNDRPDAFWRADVDEAAALLAGVVREVRPQVVVTYDENGGYGHPDHIQAHRVAMRAVELAAAAGGPGEPWAVAKVYWTALPRSVLEGVVERARASGADDFFGGAESVDDLPFVVPDELVTTEVDVRGQVPAKLAAMRAHATQIAADGPFFAFTDDAGTAWGAEHYRLVRGDVGRRDPVTDRETDLFSGTV